MIRSAQNSFLFLLICTVIVSCTGTRKLPAGEKLYTGATVKIISNEKVKNKKKIILEAKTAIKPKPNKSFLGIRPALSLYLMAGDTTKRKGIRKWLKKQGEAPVLISDTKPQQTAKFIDAKLYNIGIFKAITEYQTVEKKHSVHIIYICHIHKPYTVKELSNDIKNEQIKLLINAEQKNTFIIPGQDYDLDNLKKERERIDIILKNNGYYFFNPDYLLFKADTSQANKTISLHLTIKDETPEHSLLVYKINHITIDPNYSLNPERDSIKRDTLMVDDVVFLSRRTRIKPKIILQSVYLKKNELYSREKHNITLNRLMTMGMYKYVRIKFTESDSSNASAEKTNFLDMVIYLTPMQKRTIRLEGDIVSKSNNFIGPQLNINYRNRNEFKGAELLSLNLGGSFETQFSGKYKNLYSYSINPQIELYIPRFVVPFKIRTNSYYVPKTKFSLGYNYLRRIGYFDMRSLQFIYGFKWKETAKKEHELDPVNINYISIKNKSPEFSALIESNPFIKKSYDEQLIAGTTYSFVYNEQLVTKQTNQIYFNLTVETSGNVISLAEKIGGQEPSPVHPLRIGGSVYSQFAKIGLDLRNYSNFKNSKFVLRLFSGVGKAYGNSSTLPYTKQYFSGGPNSIRAFLINSVGPGTYRQPSNHLSVFTQQGGDVKLETNAEYRFDIFKYFKGAVFSDAGNVWLLKPDSTTSSTPFTFSTFYKEVAVGIGVGLRLDVKFFVLRFDLATPLRKPWLPEGERWVINRINFGSSSWRSENLIFNVAIGYPF